MSGYEDIILQQNAMIDTVGWAVTHVVPTEEDPETAVPFAYTVGLTGHGYPEMVISGLPPEVAHRLLNTMAQRVYDRAVRFTTGQRVSDLLRGHDVVIVGGSDTDELKPNAAFGRYGKDAVQLQQIVWPDEADRFPWEDGYNPERYPQPLLARS
jgi:hypothetical protein